MYNFKGCPWFLVACWIGLQGATGLQVGKLKVEGSRENLQLASLQLLSERMSEKLLLTRLHTGDPPKSPLKSARILGVALLPQNFEQDRGTLSSSLPPFLRGARGDRRLLNTSQTSSETNLQPTARIQSSSVLAKSLECPDDLETLISLMIRDLPSYANRVRQRSRRVNGTSTTLNYVLLAGRPEFEPLTLGPGPYTSPPPTADVEPPQQVFFTTLERQYRENEVTYLQLYHWLFLTKTSNGWRLAMMFSRIGSSSGRPPTPPQESSEGIVGQAVSTWLRDCRAGAIRTKK